MARAGEKLKLPEWLDEKFVAAALRKAEGDDELQVVGVSAADSSGGGVHSEILHVVARVRHGSGPEEQRSLIVKSLSQSGQDKEAVRVGRMFLREALCYQQMLPAVTSALKAAEGGDWRPLAATCYHAGSTPTEFLVLEDLREAGFKMVENGKLLDREHCSLVVRNLARLHAASLLFVGHESFAGPTFKKHPLYQDGARDFFRTYTRKTFEALAENLASHAGYEKYAAKYRELSADIFERVEDLAVSATPVMAVFLHGDVWKNNLMFRYSGNRVTDVRIIDFQTCFWGPPAFDLQHFLHTSASADVHRDHFDALVSEYHCSLQSSLRALGFREQADHFPLQQLAREMEGLALHGVCMAVVAPSVTLAPPVLPEDVGEAGNDVTQSDAYFKRRTSSPEFMAHIKAMAPLLEEKGAF